MEASDNPVAGKFVLEKISASAICSREQSLRLGSLLFFSVAIFYGAWLVWRAFLPLEIDPNEPWNAWLAQAATGAGPLYPSREALITNNYPPLSFFILGLAAKLTGLDHILLGRLASLVGLGASVTAVAGVVRQLGGSRAAAGLGAAWCLATIVRYCPGYVGMNDPTMLALGVMTWALVFLLHSYRAQRSTDLAIVLMVVAGFIKHNLIATPAAVLGWLWLEGDYRKALRATLIGGVVAAAGLAACVAGFGWAFAEQLFLYKRIVRLRLAWEARQLTMVALALICGLGATWRRRTWQTRFVFTFLLVALAVFIMARAGDGMDINAAFELIVATAIALPLALEGLGGAGSDQRLAPQAARLALLAGLTATLLHPPAPKAWLFWTSPEFHRARAHQVEAARAEIARVRTLAGPVSCSTETVCFEAGKAFVYDEFGMYERVATGAWSRAELMRRRAIAGVRMEATNGTAWN